MDIEIARNFLMMCSIINYSLLVLWVLVFAFAHDFLKSLIETVFRREFVSYDTTHYIGMTVYKTGIILFNIVPWIALSIVR